VDGGIVVTSTSELLLAWDQTRPRSLQRTIGMSELGGCKRRAGYRLAGQEPSDAGGSVQAVMGTAVHDAIATVLARTAGPGELAEHEVEFAGIIGHIDRYSPPVLTDVKTTTSRWLEHIKVHGPDKSHVFQTAGYAAALIKAGHPVHRIRIDYLARDTGEEWTHIRPFSQAEVIEALAWLAEVRDADLEMLPRQYSPDGPFCGHCPFRTVCWAGGATDRDPRSVLFLEDPDAARWAQQLWDARAAKKTAEELEAEAKGALDAIRPNEEGTVVVDVGWRLPLKFTVSKPPERLDTKAVRAEYAKTGAVPPVTVGKPSIRVDFEAAQ
jgi:CRISPR/Cas system-associated exonuclease Cas4 (RecB family)